MFQGFFASWRQRYQGLLPEQSFVVLQSALAALAITPFGVWRLLRGEVVQGLFDLGLVLTLLGLALFGAALRHFRVISVLFALAYTLGCAVVVARVGPAALLWSFPATVAVYFVVRAREALAISLFGLCVNSWLVHRLNSVFETWTFVTTSLLVGVFVYIFSRRMRIDNYRLQTQSTVDPLTRAGNRRLLDDMLAQLVARGAREPQSVLMLDIDFFKDVNDRFGHAAGDLCLARLVSEVKSLLNAHEHVFRYGGEEFLILTPSDEVAALALAERVRAHIEQLALIRDARITVSIGVARWAAPETVHEWLRRADDALYEAKQTGRNRVCVNRKKEARSGTGCSVGA